MYQIFYLCPQGGYSGLKMMRMIKGFFRFEIFDSGIFLGRKIWQVFFGWLDLNRDFFGVLKTNQSALLRPWRSSVNKVQTNVFCCWCRFTMHVSDMWY